MRKSFGRQGRDCFINVPDLELKPVYLQSLGYLPKAQILCDEWHVVRESDE